MRAGSERNADRGSRYLPALLALLLTAFGTHGAASTELIMLEEENCPFCEKFNAEIGEIYAKTEEGRRAPLRRVFLHEQWPADLAAIKPDTVTPVFILVSNHEEVGRLRGYQGDEFFWFLLGGMLDRLPVDASNKTSLDAKTR